MYEDYETIYFKEQYFKIITDEWYLRSIIDYEYAFI